MFIKYVYVRQSYQMYRDVNEADITRPRPDLRGQGQRAWGRGLTIKAKAERCTGMGALTTVVIMWHILVM